MHWGFYQHLNSLATYLLELKASKVHPEILASYRDKYQLLSRSSKIFRFFLGALFLHSLPDSCL
ncbi:hypothetical protein HMI54_008218 [Coelomomyces lativittatus]|nr:hypothetical protein HMI54_008218 [Coelomomyces lativittatus]